jgi:hypothetical protein
VCGFDDPPERLTGNGHSFCRLFLIQTFKIGEPDCFAFINRQDYFFQLREGDASWFEILAIR